MSCDYSENILVQGTAGDLLHKEPVYTYNQEMSGKYRYLGQ